MRKTLTVVFLFLILPLFVAGCADAENKNAQVSAQNPWPEDGPLPVLEQNKLDPHNFFPRDPQVNEVFEKLPNDHQELSEDEKLFLFPPASD